MAHVHLKPGFNEFRGGVWLGAFFQTVDESLKQGNLITLDLTEVTFMDTDGYRAIFDYLPRLHRLVPPADSHITERYNDWLDSKKGLCKNWE